MNKNLFQLVCLAIIMFSFTPKLKAQAYLDDIMLQSFGWDEYAQTRVSSEGGLYKFFGARADLLKQAGFDMIWFPPASISTGGVGYLPTQYFNFSQTSWGSEAELDAMLAAMDAAGIMSIADIVVNHRNGNSNWMDFTNPTWGCDAIVNNDEAADPTQNTSGIIPCGAADTGEGFNGGRDIDHTKTFVQNDIKQFLTLLKNKGFDGWRWDVAKGFSPVYFGEYNNASTPYYSVGEYWDGNVGALKSWIDGTGNTLSGTTNKSGAFDFSMYYALSDAVRNGNYGGLNWSGSTAGLAGQFGYADKAVSFVDNHDTFVKTEAILGDNIMKAYAYILTHPGIPCVFAPHFYGGTYSKDGVTRVYASNENPIRRLMAIRKTAGINAYSSITIAQSGSYYAAYINGDGSGDNVAVKIGPGTWNPSGTGWTLRTSGTDYAIWTKMAINANPSITVSPAGGEFLDGSTVNVTMSASDPFSEPVFDIRYTTDGSEPTISSTAYSSAFSITTDTTIKAKAFDVSGNASGTVTREYKFVSPGDITVYFKPPTNITGWIPPKIHYWGAEPAGVIADAVWTTPVTMTQYSADTAWYYYTFNGVTSINFLFRSAYPTASSAGVGGDNKTGDIVNINQDMWYEWAINNPPLYVNAVPGLSTSEVQISKETVKIYPNPAIDEVKLLTVHPFKQYEIYNMEGKQVDGGLLINKTISVQKLTPGVYFIKLTDDKGVSYMNKIIKK